MKAYLLFSVVLLFVIPPIATVFNCAPDLHKSSLYIDLYEIYLINIRNNFCTYIPRTSCNHCVLAHGTWKDDTCYNEHLDIPITFQDVITNHK